MPYSTDVHDGKIRLAGLEIIGVCLIVHIFVAADMKRVNRDLNQAIGLWQQEQMERRTSHSNRNKADEDYNNRDEEQSSSEADTASGPPKDLQARIKEVQKTSLIYRLGLVLSDFKLYAVFTSMFTHSGWLHLIGNMIFFYVCGLAMEQYWGYWRFLIIYLVCGIAADASYAVASGAHASGIPLVGASGAIAGAMGAFMVTHSRVRVKLFYTIGFWRWGSFSVPAYLYIGFWFLQQVLAVFLNRGHSSGVAYTAHIGGFLAGAIFGKLIASDYETEVVDPVLARQQQAVGHTAGKNAIPVGFNSMPAERIAIPKGYSNMPVESSAIPKGFQNMPAGIGNIPDTARAEGPDSENSLGLAAEADGWQTLVRGDAQLATRHLSYAMSCYLESPGRNRAQVVDLLGKIVKVRARLCFTQNEYYQWGKRLGAAQEFKFAIICFDLAALTEGNAHIQKNSLLESSRLRIQTAYQFDKVRRDMQFLLTLEPQGIFANQAREIIGQLKGVTQLMR